MGKIWNDIKEFKLSFLNEISLEKKILLTFTGTLAVSFLITGMIISSRITESIIVSTETAVLTELSAHDNALLSLERSFKGKINALAKDTNLLGEYGDITNVLNAFSRDNKEFSQIMLGKNDGTFIEIPKHTREKSFDPRNTIWYKDAVAAGSTNMMIVTAPFQGLDNAARVGFYKSLQNYSESYGVVGGTIDFAELFKMTGNTENIIILDADNTIVFDNNNMGNLFQKINNVNSGELSILGQKNEGVSKVSLNNENMLAVVYKSGTTGLKYIKLINYSNAISPANTLTNIVIIAFLIVLIISLLLSKLLYRHIKKSFMSIEAQTEAIGAGHLDNITSVNESSDEVGRLSFAFGKMAGNVKSRLMKMETESQNLRALLKDIADELEISKASSKNSTDNINAASKLEATNIEDINDVNTEIAAIEGDLLKISDFKAKGKTDITTLLNDIDLLTNQAAEDFKNNTNKIKAQNEEFSATFKKESETLSEALQKIADNASEISLMAFSAALEAAKGKGEKTHFAKIAEDIRKLSETVAKSAGDGLKDVNKLAPKFEEYNPQNFEKEFIKLTEKAKEIGNVLDQIELSTTNLQNTAKNAKASVGKLSARENETMTSIKETLKFFETNDNSIEKMEQIVEKAFT